MKKILFILIFLLYLSLSGCVSFLDGDEEEVVKEDKPKAFKIETISLDDLSSMNVFKKNGRVVSTNQININAQANGRISNILVKEGDSVVKDQKLLDIQDEVSNYGLKLQNSQISLQQSQLDYEQTKIDLEKNIRDLERVVQQKELDYESKKQDLEKQLTQQKYDLSLGDLENENSVSSKELKNLENQLEKLNLEISNLKEKNQHDNSIGKKELENLDNRLEKLNLEISNLQKGNQQSINNLKTNLQNNYQDYINLLSDINYEADMLLGVSNENKNANNSFEIYLGARNSSQKNNSKNLLKNSIQIYNKIDKNNYQNISNDEVINKVNYLLELIDGSINLINSIDTTLKNSTTSTTLSQNKIDGFINKFIGLRGNVQSLKSKISNFENEVESFFENYLNQEELLQKEIENLNLQKNILKENLKQSNENYLNQKELLQKEIESLNLQKSILEKNLQKSSFSQKINIDRTIINKKEIMDNAKISLDKAKDDLQKAKQDKEITLQSLQNNIKNTQTQLQEVSNQFSKLNVKSPISGKISSVLVDNGQQVNQGEALFEISGSGGKEIRLSFRDSELDNIYVGMNVEIVHNGESYIGNIYSISDLADDNLNYTARVRLDKQIARLGNFVTVVVFVDVGKPIIPVNVLNNIKNNQANINLYYDGDIKTKTVSIQEIIGNGVIIEDEIDPKYLIISSDIRTFNKDDHYIVNIN
ncbi:HlyD family efflux transporter periplasmic adaptor subunit [Candidatus Vampirococcus lugosii]|uniref:Hemolysin translocator, HlyD family secretion protein n=1 Tax=Candidatus Vampirococcus lugosii TaxID=2789015 RepID=A0ABS5QKD2_9BACT|nr:HlyD family efflux transporter periplasmic adaptor subunit [Candidatus Vampirococcus lugosii]MBS8121589.1 putative hemolysin translocator, HlyD family secretion protein [Candidatus Vampirococcus lugosii]